MKEKGINKDLISQINVLKMIIMKSDKLKKILEILDKNFDYDYYVAAGAINQTVFNYYHNFEIDNGIDDVDIVYFDPDLSYEKEDEIIKKLSFLLKDINIKLDIKNQARVHLWYKNKYKKDVRKNDSVETAVSRFASTVTCIGVKMSNGNFKVFAPYGLNDLFKMVIRPVKENVTKEDYDKKCLKWKKKWPLLTIIPWDNN